MIKKVTTFTVVVAFIAIVLMGTFEYGKASGYHDATCHEINWIYRQVFGYTKDFFPPGQNLTDVSKDELNELEKDLIKQLQNLRDAGKHSTALREELRNILRKADSIAVDTPSTLTLTGTN